MLQRKILEIYHYLNDRKDVIGHRHEIEVKIKDMIITDSSFPTDQLS
ncbi:MAG TPA: hypothetical protein VFY64_11920 [Nitrososphaeraceae archaeon]|nr:hypothetical protein [Nitrososphaeraceae archaeon]